MELSESPAATTNGTSVWSIGDFPAIPSMNKALVMELARCEYIERRDNVIAVGNQSRSVRPALGWARNRPIQGRIMTVTWLGQGHWALPLILLASSPS